jgi:hypothetical protein
MSLKKFYPPISEDKIKEVPYAERKCRLCQLDIEYIRELNKRKFEDKLNYESMRTHIKEKYKLGVDFTEISKHFNMHVLGKALVQAKLSKPSDCKYPEVAKALEPISSVVKVTTNADLEKAYESLVKMAATFVARTYKMQDLVAKVADEREKNEELDEELDHHTVMDLLERQAKLNQEARSFIKDISALRAPKVMVAQFLESFIDEVLKELSILLSNLCGELQFDIVNELAEAGHQGLLMNETFSKVFKKTALDYRDRMITLKRQKMSDAMAALQDLEKIV